MQHDHAEDNLEIEILREMGNMGAGNAAAALSELIHQEISISIPEVYVIPQAEISDITDSSNTPSIIVYMELPGETRCKVLLSFRRDEAEKLLSIIIQNSLSPDDMDWKMEMSILDETGNIVIGAFLSAISDFTGLELLPAPPKHRIGMLNTILNDLLIQLHPARKESVVTVVFKAFFECKQKTAYGTMMMLMNEKLQKLLVQEGRKWIDQ